MFINYIHYYAAVIYVTLLHLCCELHVWTNEGPVDCSIVVPIHCVFLPCLLPYISILGADLIKVIVDLVLGQPVDQLGSEEPAKLAHVV